MLDCKIFVLLWPKLIASDDLLKALTRNSYVIVKAKYAKKRNAKTI